jgi:hypothetical protein
MKFYISQNWDSNQNVDIISQHEEEQNSNTEYSSLNGVFYRNALYYCVSIGMRGCLFDSMSARFSNLFNAFPISDPMNRVTNATRQNILNDNCLFKEEFVSICTRK